MRLYRLIQTCVLGVLIAGLWLVGANAQTQNTARAETDQTYCRLQTAGSPACDIIRAREILDPSTAPWNVIGRVNFASIQIRSHCTGTLVSERHVLTAAHCLYNQRRKNWIPVQSLKFAAGYDRGSANTVATVVRYILHPDHDANSRIFASNPRTDWALLELDRPIGAEIGFATISDVTPSSGIRMAGYAALRPHVLSLAQDCATADTQSLPGVLLTRCAAMHGDSGAPLFFLQDGQLQIVGILSAGTSDQRGIVNLSVPAVAFSEQIPTN